MLFIYLYMFIFSDLSYSFTGFKSFNKNSFASLEKILLFFHRKFYACRAKNLVNGSSYIFTFHFSSTSQRLRKKGDMM
jgi:hypothetical protein